MAVLRTGRQPHKLCVTEISAVPAYNPRLTSAHRSQRTFKLVNLSAPSQNRAWLNSLSWSMGKQIKCLEAVP